MGYQSMYCPWCGREQGVRGACDECRKRLDVERKQGLKAIKAAKARREARLMGHDPFRDMERTEAKEKTVELQRLESEIDAAVRSHLAAGADLRKTRDQLEEAKAREAEDLKVVRAHFNHCRQLIEKWEALTGEKWA